MLGSSRSKIAGHLCRIWPARLARRFAKQQDGAAAIEFALVAVPFLGLVFAILETALVFFAGQTLETAVQDSARLIMTGQAQSQGWNKDQFKTQVCARIHGLFDCVNGVYVDVKTYNNFGAIDTTPPLTSGNFDDTKLQYSPGGVGSIEVVTLYYQWPIYVTLLGNGLSNLSNNKRLLIATAVFRNEPYE